jgi:hypothetical protein
MHSIQHPQTDQYCYDIPWFLRSRIIFYYGKGEIAQERKRVTLGHKEHDLHLYNTIIPSQRNRYGVKLFDDVSRHRRRDQDRCIEKCTKLLLRTCKDVQNLPYIP